MSDTKAINPEDKRRRATETVARLTEERVTITDDGEVISSDPIARLYVHCIYYPEIYGVATETPSR